MLFKDQCLLHINVSYLFDYAVLCCPYRTSLIYYFSLVYDIWRTCSLDIIIVINLQATFFKCSYIYILNVRIFILKLEIEEHISSNWEFCDQFKFFFLKWVQYFSIWVFSPNVVLKFGISSIWVHNNLIWERHNFLCVGSLELLQILPRVC